MMKRLLRILDEKSPNKFSITYTPESWFYHLFHISARWQMVRKFNIFSKMEESLYAKYSSKVLRHSIRIAHVIEIRL